MGNQKEQSDSSSQLEPSIKMNTPDSKLEAVIRQDGVLKELGTHSDLWPGPSINSSV